jgi:hypothetical protein
MKSAGDGSRLNSVAKREGRFEDAVMRGKQHANWS